MENVPQIYPLSSPLTQVGNAGGQHHSDSLTPPRYPVTSSTLTPFFLRRGSLFLFNFYFLLFFYCYCQWGRLFGSNAPKCILNKEQRTTLHVMAMFFEPIMAFHNHFIFRM